MLVILAMLIGRAREARNWQWLTGDGGDQTAAAAAHGQAAPATAEPTPATGPNDQDREEQEGAQEEFQAVTDRAALTAIEMPSYWRLAGWAHHSPLENLVPRARRDRTFRQFLEEPAKCRGELVRLRLHLNMVLPYDATENDLGVSKVYEAWGATDESRVNPYAVVFTELPPDMPTGERLSEEATFYGYFFKLIAYGAVDDKQRVAPLLIGRVVWHPLPAPSTDSDSWSWAAMGLGGCLGAYLLWRVAMLLGKRTRRRADADDDGGPRLDAWLQTPADDDADATTRVAHSNGHAGDESDERDTFH